MPAVLLTTGSVARLCSVKPDTVLKWIKKGRLPAARTAGGHYRIDEEDLLRLGEPGGTKAVQETKRASLCSRPMRCWEYMSNGPGDECRECTAYKFHASWCFRIVGHGQSTLGRFCKSNCQECPYYRRVHGFPTNILVITGDDNLAHSLAKQGGDRLSFRFARRGYDTSAILDVFRPAYVVFDQAVLENLGMALLDALALDPRAIGVRILVAIRQGTIGFRVSTKAVLATIEEPFSADDLIAIIDRTIVEPLPQEETSPSY